MSRLRLAVVLALGLALAGCAGPASSPSVSGDGIEIDVFSALSVLPVDFDGRSVLTAAFGRILPSRPVTLQRLDGSKWADVAEAKLDGYGEAEFQIPTVADTDQLRAVAQEYATGGTTYHAVATPINSAKAGWGSRLDSKFAGDAGAYKKWRIDQTPAVTGCTVLSPENVLHNPTDLALHVSKETSPNSVFLAKQSGCPKSSIYRGAMTDTDGRFQISSGIVAARVKFPKSQAVRGSVVLVAAGGARLRIADSLGWGQGLSSSARLGGLWKPADNGAPVGLAAAAQEAWWDAYHVVSVEWNDGKVVYRVDGQVTLRLDLVVPPETYYLELSIVVKDPSAFRKPSGNAKITSVPQTMSVTWAQAWNSRT